MAHAAAVIGNMEIIQVADAVAREKGISKDEVLDAMAQAIQVAGRRKYGHDMRIRAEINSKTGHISLFREREVVEEVENSMAELTLEDAQSIDKTLEIGSIITDELPPIDFGRIAAQTAKQVIIQKVRDAERTKQYEEFKDRVGEIISGTVKRIEYGNVIVDFGSSEAIIPRNNTIPREHIKQNERIRAVVEEVNPERPGHQVVLSRTHPAFLAQLFAQEVPEIYDGIIEIKAVARDPGSRAKICVTSHDSSIDPVGSCVGVRGSRVQAVINELQGEKIDIIPFTPDMATLVVSALSPAEVSKVVIDEEKERIEAVVPEEFLSQAIGRRGQNVRLASEITGWEIDILTDEEESKRRAEEFTMVSTRFIEALNVEDVIGELLVAEGFQTLEEVAYISLEELASVEGFDEDIAAELQNRARAFLDEQANEAEKICKELGADVSLVELLEKLTMPMLAALAKHDIKTRDDLADLSRDEFKEYVPESDLGDGQIDDLIMEARAHWFEDDNADSEQASA